VVLGITLLIVGMPMWSYYWIGLQKEVATGPTEERTALSRRVFIYGVFGIATLLVLGNLSALLFMFLRDLLEAELSLQVLQDAKWSIGILLMSGGISVYHWLVLQEDRRELPAGETPPKEETPAVVAPVAKEMIALATQSAQGLVARLESQLGVPIRVWRRLDAAEAPTVTEEELLAIRQRVIDAPGDRVLLTIDASGVSVLPYRE